MSTYTTYADFDQAVQGLITRLDVSYLSGLSLSDYAGTGPAVFYDGYLDGYSTKDRAIALRTEVGGYWIEDTIAGDN